MQYEILGGNLPVVICELDNEGMFTQAGGMSWMAGDIRMKTTSQGGFSRMLSKESLFMNEYEGTGQIAFSSTFPGSIKTIDVTETGYLVQKRAFLAAQDTVKFNAVITGLKKGLFGGEGFILQELTGQGLCFLEIDGSGIEYELDPGQIVTVSTGHVAAFEKSVKMDVRSVSGIKNKFLGGEGLFFTTLEGPGRIILQTMPASKTALALQPFFTTKN